MRAYLLISVVLVWSLMGQTDPGMPNTTDLSGRFYRAIRNLDLSTLKGLLKTGDVKVTDNRGTTPLMYAAAIGNVEEMKLLLDAGADVDAKNAFNATALIWAAGDPVKSRMLIEHGADVKVQSQQGRTPLMAAARRDANLELLRLLLVKGANPNAKDGQGGTALHFAAQRGDVEAMRLLIDNGAEVNADAVNQRKVETPLLNAIRSNNVDAVRLLLASRASLATPPAGPLRIGNIPAARGKMTPLMWAAPYGSADVIRILIEAGADVNAQDIRGISALMLAVSSETQDVEVVKLLLKAGADVNLRSSIGETALDWTRKFGSATVMAALQEAGAKQGVSYSPPATPKRGDPPDPAKAVEKSIALLQRSSTEFFRQSGCVACHHQPMTAIAVRAARNAGIPVDEAAAREQLNVIRARATSLQETYLQGMSESPDTLLTFLQGLWTADRLTDSWVADIASLQRSDGSWQRTEVVSRAPIVESSISLTARAIQALQFYRIPAREAEFKSRVARACAWLLKVKPRTTDEYAYLLLGLSSAGTDKGKVRDIADSLIAQQRADGGWAGNPNLTSDAYATGEVLYALRESGFVRPGSKVHQRGVQFLLSTQYPDGSWYVRSRAVKVQPYFQSGFPFEHDQWISAAATAWSAMAVSAQLEQQQTAARR